MTTYSRLAGTTPCLEFFVLRHKVTNEYLARQCLDNSECDIYTTNDILNAEVWYSEAEVGRPAVSLPDGESLDDYYIRRVELSVSEYINAL